MAPLVGAILRYNRSMTTPQQTRSSKDNQLPSNFRVSIKVLVRGERGTILMVQEGGEAWGIPGGGLNHGETIEQGLRREVREELGVEVGKVPALPILAETYYYEAFNRWRLWLLFEVSLEGAPMVGRDSQAVGWFGKDQLSGLPLDQTEDVAVKDVFIRFL